MKKKCLFVLCIVCYCFVIKYMFYVLFPFLLSILCFFVIKPLIDDLERRFSLRRSIIGMSLLSIIYIVIVMIVGGIITYGMSFLMEWMEDIPYLYQHVILPFIEDILMCLEKHIPFLFQKDILSFFNNYSQKLIFSIMNAAPHFLTYIPTIFLYFFLFIISSFFFVVEYDQIKEKIIDIFPKNFISSFVYIKDQCMKSLSLYFQCQMILMIICFVILVIGMKIIRIDNYAVLALVTALFDSLPFIGVGIVLFPLALLFLIKQAYLKCIYVLLLYFIINCIRSILEPHIMNKQMKIPSFFLLLSMMMHLYFFGVIGIFLSPIHMNILYSLLDYKS